MRRIVGMVAADPLCSARRAVNCWRPCNDFPPNWVFARDGDIGRERLAPSTLWRSIIGHLVMSRGCRLSSSACVRSLDSSRGRAGRSERLSWSGCGTSDVPHFTLGPRPSLGAAVLSAT